MTKHELQMHMARFAMHKCRVKEFAMEVYSGKISEDQAKEKYRLGMENFDALMTQALDGNNRYKGCAADMSQGFVLPKLGS